MSYKNKTYVIFDADNDIKFYRTMTMWKANDKIDFDFYDAHDINNLWGKSSEKTIKDKLRERMQNSKQSIVLVGETTKNLYKFVRWEIEIAIGMDIPIIAANLDKSNAASTTKTPPILDDTYFVSVPFEMKKIRYALDNFPDSYHKNKGNKSGAHHYADWSNLI